MPAGTEHDAFRSVWLRRLVHPHTDTMTPQPNEYPLGQRLIFTRVREEAINFFRHRVQERLPKPAAVPSFADIVYSLSSEISYGIKASDREKYVDRKEKRPNRARRSWSFRLQDLKAQDCACGLYLRRFQHSIPNGICFSVAGNYERCWSDAELVFLSYVLRYESHTKGL